MPTTSPDGIYYADSSTAMSAEAISAAEATSVQDALTAIKAVRQIQTFVWANSSERLAESGMIAGDEGYQSDTQVGYRYNGTSWAIWSAPATSFTPSWTNLTVGAGSNTGVYTVSDGIARVEFATILGAGLSVGAARLALPLTGVFTSNNMPVGRVAYVDSGTGTFRGDVFAFSATAVDLRHPGGALFWSSISSTTPFTWVATDSLIGSFTYRVA